MGNQNNSKFKKISQIYKQQNKQNKPYKKYSTNPQLKYRFMMIQALQNSNFSSTLQLILKDTLQNKITNEQLIKTISRINILKNNQFIIHNNQQLNISQKRKITPRVDINFSQWQNNKQKQKNNINNVSQLLLTSQMKIIIQENIEILRKELNIQSHPFWRLCKSFSQYLFHNLSEIITYPSNNLQSYQKDINKLLWTFITYLQQSCLLPYKKWIQKEFKLNKNKISKIIKKLFMQEIWRINHGYLFNVLQHIIMSRKVPLNIIYQQLHYNSPIITPVIFHIEPQLAIQGHFFDGIYQCAQLEQKITPETNIKQLQLIKHCICNDIDNYYRLSSQSVNKDLTDDQKKVYEIDSDNILGIISYILCKIPNKLQKIYTHLIYLRIIYGDLIYYGMDVSSYMFSTIIGAFEYLESENFRVSLKKCRFLLKNSFKQKKKNNKNNQQQEQEDSQLNQDNNLNLKIDYSSTTEYSQQKQLNIQNVKDEEIEQNRIIENKQQDLRLSMFEKTSQKSKEIRHCSKQK